MRQPHQPRSPERPFDELVAEPAYMPTASTHLGPGLSVAFNNFVATRPYPRINDFRTDFKCCDHCAHLELLPHPYPCPHGCNDPIPRGTPLSWA